MHDIYTSSTMYHPRPYVMFSGKPGGTVTVPDKMADIHANTRTAVIQYDSLGFRIGKKLSKEKEKDAFRIFMVGGSTVFHGSPLENTIPGQLEKLFHAKGQKHVQVYNFGVPSYVSGQELALMVHLLPDLDPDLVVVYDGGNDVTHPCFFEPRPGYPYNFMVNEYLLRSLQENPSGKMTIDIKKDMDFDGLRDTCGYGTESWETNIVTEYVRNIHKMFKIAKGLAFNMALFLQPLLVFKKPMVGNESQLLGVKPFQEYLCRQYGRIRSALATLQQSDRELSGRVFDLSKIFDNYQEETFWDYIHVDNTGNGHVARHIFEKLEGMV